MIHALVWWLTIVFWMLVGAMVTNILGHFAERGRRREERRQWRIAERKRRKRGELV